MGSISLTLSVLLILASVLLVSLLEARTEFKIVASKIIQHLAVRIESITALQLNSLVNLNVGAAGLNLEPARGQAFRLFGCGLI